MKKLIVICTLALLGFKTQAQNANACNAAQPVCQNPNFQFTSSMGTGLPTGLNVSNPTTNPQTGNGNSPTGPSNSGCLLSNGPGPQWLLLTVSSTGTLGFSFGAASSANPQAGFYDWAMWPYTPTSCASIFANTLPPVACNWNASSSGGTGMGPPPVGGNVGNFQPPLNVTVGQQFVICISNYSGVNTPVSFSNNGSAGLSCNPFVIPPITICNGTSGVLSGTTTLTNASATITPGGNVSVGSAINFTMSPSTTTAYTVTLVGTDATNAVVTSTTVTNITVINSSVAINSASTVCEGGSVNLTANATGTSVAYNWNGTSGFTSATQNPVMNNLLPTASGVYTVQANITTGTLVCSATNTTNVTVIPVAQVTVSPSTVNICQGLSFNLTAGAANATSYSWSGPSFSSANQNPSFVNVTPSMTGIYTVTAFFSQNNVNCSTTNTVDVTVNTALFFGFNPIASVCDNGVISVPGPAGATSYTWTGPGGYTSNSQNLNIPNANSTMSGVYTLTVTANGGCLTTSNINVTVLPPVSFVIVPNNGTICEGDTISLATQVTGGSGIYNVNWSPGAGLSNTSGTSVVASPLSTTQYNISASDVNCPMQTINALVTVSVNPKPVPNVSASKINGCVPLCIDLQSNSNPPAASVQWNFGGNLSASGDPVNYCFKKAGTYSIRTIITDINGCKSVTMAGFQITAYPRPEPNINWSPSEISVIDNIGSFYSSSPTGSIASYFWDFGDMVNNPASNNATTQNATHEFDAVGIYPVTMVMTNVWGCTDTLIKAVEVIEDFTMYIPNAFSPNGDGINDFFQPKGMGWMPDKYEFLIYDRWGNLIFKTNDYTKGWDGTVKGSGGICPTDVYVYKIKATSSAHSERKEFTGHVTLMK
jgi:gliding motility-associated-like protein